MATENIQKDMKLDARRLRVYGMIGCAKKQDIAAGTPDGMRLSGDDRPARPGNHGTGRHENF